LERHKEKEAVRKRRRTYKEERLERLES